jgi:hypothetical protein
VTNLLDLPLGVGQRSESVRWELVDTRGVHIGEMHPDADNPPSLSVSSSASIVKTIRDAIFDSRELADVNTFRSRLRPRWVLEDGTEWPLGEFFFTDAPQPLGTGPRLVTTTLFDGLVQVDVASDRTWGVATGESIRDTMIEIIQTAGIARYKVSATDAVAQAPITWPIGTNLREILKQLCNMVGFLPPYFANDCYLTMRPIDQLSPGANNRKYDEKNSRVAAGSGTYNANLLNAPNVFVVVGAGATQGEVVARAYVDPQAPHSRENRGFVVPRVYTEQGITDTATAQLMANAYAAAAPNSYETVSFTSSPDPRHDVFTLVDFYGTTYRELSHTLPLTPGGDHAHVCAKVLQ